MNKLIAGAVATASAMTSLTQAADVTFTLQAQEFAAGVPWLKAGIPIPIAEDGRIVFATEAYSTFDDGLIAHTAGVHTPIALTGVYDEVSSIAINSAGNIAFVADRTNAGSPTRGVYRTTSGASPITTIHEDLQNVSTPATARFVALAENNTVAFSTIRSAAGAIYRGDVTGAPSILRSGSGTFFNTQRVDVNNAGTVVAQMEYGSPIGPLSRAIIGFDTPEQTITNTKTAIEQTNVSIQPMPSINASGQVAFALNTSVTMKFFDPPNVFSPTPEETITLQPGVYVTSLVGLGLTPRSFTQIANTAGEFDSFGRVVINDLGQVVFEADLDGGPANGGIFAGGDPVLDRLLLQGDQLEAGRTISIIELGDLNNAGQFTVLTSWFEGDRQVWMGQIPEPSALALLAFPLLAMKRRRR